MNTDSLKGQWKQIKGKVKQQWSELTDDEIDRIDGNSEELAGLLQERYGYSKDKAKQEIKELSSGSSQI